MAGLASKTKRLKKAAAELRKQSGRTIFRRASKGEQGPCKSLQNAKLGMEKISWDHLELAIPASLNILGAKLSKMSQALLYQGILERRTKPSRRGTTICLDMARHGVKEIAGYLPTDKKIWYSLRNKDISRNVRAYLWKCMHRAHRCGGYWLKLPGYEQRAECRICGSEESMEHILTECQGSGQKTVWKLVQELLTRKGIPQTATPTFGQILGSSLASFHDQKGKLLKGSSRLYTIIISESAYLVWRLRCEWRIERDEDKNRLHTEAEIANQWLNMVNTRLKLDCLMTDKKRYGRKATNPDKVEQTWCNVLHDERGLPDGWIVNSEVLVGMRVARPPGRNR